jgi:hypothetical protein
MATSRHRALAASVVVLTAALAGAGCFKPNIAEGGFLCGDGGACPEGFRCATDGTCRKGVPPACQAAAPHIQPICSLDGGTGTQCDPICQSNCACGRCSIKAAALTCISIGGEKKHGDFCNPDAGADECAPGNICQSDCNNAVARCVRFCASDGYTDPTVCPGGQRCDNAVRDPITGANTTATACAPPAVACNPVTDSNDCGNAALGCYVSNTGGVPVCDCKGTGGAGEPCFVYNSCIPGFRCVTVLGATTCHKTCSRSANDCPTGACTGVGGGDFGYCP